MTKIPYTGTNQAEFKAILGDKVLDPYFCMGLTILSILTDDGFVNDPVHPDGRRFRERPGRRHRRHRR